MGLSQESAESEKGAIRKGDLLPGLDFRPEKVRKNRNLDLIAEFPEGYAKGWFFAVSKAFRDQLDIRYTDRIKTTRKINDKGEEEEIKTLFKEWTQGRYFCFAEGHILYDTTEAGRVWSEAMEHIRYVCKVINGTPNRVALDEETGVSEKVFLEGQVFFQLLTPDDRREKLVVKNSFRVTQREFVIFLKSGRLKGAPIEDLPADPIVRGVS